MQVLIDRAASRNDGLAHGFQIGCARFEHGRDDRRGEAIQPPSQCRSTEFAHDVGYELLGQKIIRHHVFPSHTDRAQKQRGSYAGAVFARRAVEDQRQRAIGNLAKQFTP
jgi:hypothetical protein